MKLYLTLMAEILQIVSLEEIEKMSPWDAFRTQQRNTLIALGLPAQHVEYFMYDPRLFRFLMKVIHCYMFEHRKMPDKKWIKVCVGMVMYIPVIEKKYVHNDI